MVVVIESMGPSIVQGEVGLAFSQLGAGGPVDDRLFSNGEFATDFVSTRVL